MFSNLFPLGRGERDDTVNCYGNLKTKPPKTPTLRRPRRRQRRRSEPGSPPALVGFSPDSAALDTDRLAPGDRICSVNGIATARLSNDEVLRLLDNVEERASLEVEYYMPNYASQNSLYVTTKVAEVPVEKVSGSLGITIRGGVPEPAPVDLVLNTRSLDAHPLLVTHVRPGGAAYNTSRIKPGDRLLKVDHISLSNKTLSEVHSILQNCPQMTSLTIEYDVSIMESVKQATGPLLIEIERPCNEDLGLFLSNQRLTDDCYSTDTYQRVGSYNAIFIDSILPASISDRCGALHPGDQVLAFDDHVVEGSGYTAEEVMCYLETCERAFTRLHVAPRHVLQGNVYIENSVSNSSTLSARRQRQRDYRQSSLPKLGNDEYETVRSPMGPGLCRTEELSVQLEVLPSQASGLVVARDRDGLRVAAVVPHSPAYRSGCIQVRDRVVSINGHENLSAEVANDLLQRRNDSSTPKLVTLKIEFSMPDAIEASSGVFNVKLPKASAGLGITITGCKQATSGGEPLVISDIRPGSAAHRSGALARGDLLLAINRQPLHNLALDTAFNILQSSSDDIITLKVRKCEEWSSGERKPSLQSFCNVTETRAQVHGADSGIHTDTDTDSPNNSAKDSHRSNLSDAGNTEVLNIELVKEERGPLGLTIAGSEDVTQPILLSGLVPGGVAEQCGRLMIGDELLTINGESVLSRPLSEAIRLLQAAGRRVTLQLCRKHAGGSVCSADGGSPRGSPHSPHSTHDNHMHANSEVIEYAIPDKSRIPEKQYSGTDEDKLLAGVGVGAGAGCDLPLPNYSLHNSLKTFQYDVLPLPLPGSVGGSHAPSREEDLLAVETLTANMRDCRLYSPVGAGSAGPSPRAPRTPHTGHRSPTDSAFHYSPHRGYENGMSGGESVQQVILYKDAIYDDYGFSVSDGLYERGVYINRIRAGGPADIVGLLRPYDRILQVNGTCTASYDCCLTVPLIAAATDRLHIVVQRHHVTGPEVKPVAELEYSPPSAASPQSPHRDHRDLVSQTI